MWFWGLKVAVVCVTGVILVVRTLFPILSFSYFLLLWWRDVVMNLPFLRPSIFSDFLDQCGPFQSLDVLARISPYFWFGKRRRHRPSPCPRCPRRLLPGEFFRRKWTRLNKFIQSFHHDLRDEECWALSERFNFHFSVDSSPLSLGILWSLCNKIRSSSLPKSELLSEYSMRSFVLVEGRLRVTGRWLVRTTGVPTIQSDISVFLSVFRVFSVIFRFVVILWTETFVILTGIVLFVILWINSESLWRCAEKTDVALGGLVLRLRGLQLLRHIVELAMMYSVNRNSEKKNQNNKPTTQVPSGETAWNPYPNSIIVVQDSSGVVDWCMYEQPTELGSSYIAIDSTHLMSSQGVTSSIWSARRDECFRKWGRN